MMSGDEFHRMSQYRRLRKFLELRLFDVQAATGIPAQRLSAAESGRHSLTKPEEALLRGFLKARLELFQAETNAEGTELPLLPA